MSTRHPSGAELQLDVSTADWILPRLLPWGAGMGTPVCSVVPTGYEAYVRIFHHVQELEGTTWVRRRWAELAARSGLRMHPAVQFERLSATSSPNTGQLANSEATALVEVLRAYTSTTEACWLAIWEGYSGVPAHVAALVDDGRKSSEAPAPVPTVSLPAREYVLFRGPIDVVTRGLIPDRQQTPNLWWPEDRAWVVVSEIDLDSTIVACVRACADALLSSDLEALEVSPDVRLDIAGDTLNPR